MKTKAVTDKKIYDNNLKYTLVTKETPNTILGVWIINHDFKSVKVGNDLQIEGSFEVNVWYSYADNTKTNVATRIVTYSETIPKIFNDDSDYSLRVLGNPTCRDSSIEDGVILVEVFKQFEIEVIDEIEIKEEIEKPQEIKIFQDYTSKGKLHDYINIDGNKYAISVPQREIIKGLNYLLKKEENK